MANKHPKNQFPKGRSGNPKGRPQKGESLTDVIREFMEKDQTNKRTGETKPRKQLFAEAMFGASLSGNVNAMRLMMNYLDGVPKEKKEEQADMSKVDQILAEMSKEAAERGK